MHVLQLGPYPPPEGGISRNMLAIRDELAKSGHRCSIIAIPRSTRMTVEPDVHRPDNALEVVKLLFTINRDLLHLHLGGAISKRVLALAFICTIAGRGKKVLSLHSGGYPTSKKGRTAKRNSIRGFVFRRFDRVIAVNPMIADVFRRYAVPPDRIRVIPPFANLVPDPEVSIPDELRDFCGKHRPFLLTVGLLEPEYDLHMQINAMEQVLRKFPDAGLMIVGSGSLEADLRAAIASKSYKDRIFLAGDVEHKVTLHLVNNSDVLLRTTLFDGDAISVREALFLGTPVIATDNGSRPDGVHLIPIHDEDALVGKIGTVVGVKTVTKEQKTASISNIFAVLELYNE